MSKYWLVYKHGDPVELYGLFRRLMDAKATYDTERENLRASGNGSYTRLEIEALEPWSPSSARRGKP